MNDLVVGVDLGGTNMQLGVVDAVGGIVAQIKKKTKASKGTDVLFERLVEAICDVCAEAGTSPSNLGGVGLAVAAAVDREKGLVIDAPNLGWRDFPIARELKERLQTPVAVENDVNAAVLGEHQFGAIKGEREALGVWVGTGVGGALILNGDLHHGALGTAGEIGHTTLLPNAPIGHRKLEDICSRTAVVRRLAQLAPGSDTVLHELSKGDVGSIRSSVISKAYASGDALTLDVVHEAADLLAVGVASAVTLLAMPVVLLGGGLTEAIGEPFVDRVRRGVHAHVFPTSLRAVRVIATELDEKAGILGGAIAIRRLLDGAA